MAQLSAPQNSGFNVDDLPPPGTCPAVILDILDTYGVERPKYENPQEKEKLDVTRFLFGYVGNDGRLYRIQTREMRISGNPKAKLFQFLQSLLGHPPKYGWDYCELVGKPAMITVMHQQGRRDPSKTYAGIASIAPLPQQMLSAVPPVSAFNYTREQNTPQSQPATQRPATPTQAPQQTWQQPQATPAHPAPQQSWTPPQQAQPSAQPQQPAAQQAPTGLWNPETDGDDNCPF